MAVRGSTKPSRCMAPDKKGNNMKSYIEQHQPGAWHRIRKGNRSHHDRGTNNAGHGVESGAMTCSREGSGRIAFVAVALAALGLMGLGRMIASAQNPVPRISEPLVPASTAPGRPAFTLTVSGTGFVPSSVVHWNSVPRPTAYVSSSQLTTDIPASDTAAASTAWITVSSPSPGGGTSDLAFLPITWPTDSIRLARTDYPAPGGNVRVVTADFNGDGKLDLASASWGDSQVGIFLGNGDGTFQPYQSFYAFGAYDLATGDFNRDGRVDLAVATCANWYVLIFLGNGDGTFTPGVILGIPQAPRSVCVGDFNSDGKLDVATANDWLQGVSVFLGNGDGTFRPRLDYYAGGGRCYKMATADFNGDGRLDLAVSTSDNFVSILLGNGDGTFALQPRHSIPYYDNYYLTVADLNTDSWPDIAVASQSGWITVLLGNGDGTFHTGGSYETVADALSVTTADLNGDGILDLVTANSNPWAGNLCVLLGKGDGTFQNHVDYSASSGACGLAVADFNRDSMLDLVTGNPDSISIFLQAPPPARISLTSEGSCLDAQITFSQQDFSGDVFIPALPGAAPGVPSSLVFEMLGGINYEQPDTFEFYLNGMLLGTMTAEAGGDWEWCPPIRSFAVNDAGLIARAWHTGGNNVFRFIKNGWNYLSWARVRFPAGGSSESLCLVSFGPNGCDETCLSAGYSDWPLDEWVTLVEPFVPPLVALHYQDGVLFGHLDISSLATGENYTLCVACQRPGEPQAQKDCAAFTNVAGQEKVIINGPGNCQEPPNEQR